MIKRIINIICGLFFVLFNAFDINCSIITTLNKNDPAPFFSTIFPYNYLSQNEKEYLKEHTDFLCPQYFSFSVNPFYQTASRGWNINRCKSELGDLTGRWNMIAVLPFANPNANDIPEGSEPFPRLEHIRNNLFGCIDFAFRDTTGQRVPDELKTVPGLLSLQTPEELLGFFSVPIKYRKAGVRFEANARIYRDFGCSFQTGVADISQVARFIDQTTASTACTLSAIETGSTPPSCQAVPCNPEAPLYCLNPFTENKVTNENWRQVVDCVHIELMNKLQPIINEIGLDLCNYNKTSIEDIHFEFWWRHMYNIKPTEPDCCWIPFLFVPFVSVGASIATGKKAVLDNPLSLPFGNNGHHAVRFNAGFSLDFYDTVEVGMHSGLAYFFKNKFCGYRVPTNDYQNVIIPYKTDVEIQPGPTWHVGLFLNCFHFIDCVSAYVEYLYISHIRDKITVLSNNQNGAFKPNVLECTSPWNTQLLNGALNYDVSPNFALGFAVQIPLAGRNVYKSTTYMVSTTLTF